MNRADRLPYQLGGVIGIASQRADLTHRIEPAQRLVLDAQVAVVTRFAQPPAQAREVDVPVRQRRGILAILPPALPAALPVLLRKAHALEMSVDGIRREPLIHVI